jgi:2-polyprenyl-3-methyl-5-hydroxy-6-metoxy-1,4-benzoquinol methylase
MSLGSTLRGLLGPLEKPVSEIYRAAFLNLDALADLLEREVNPRRILEIGCGEGSLSERLARRFPKADVLGVDILPRVGRLVAVRPPNLRFAVRTAHSVAEAEPAGFDLVVLCDVLHHVPLEERDSILRAAADTVSPGGLIAVKDWERKAGFIHALAYASDRYITGDRIVYETAAQWRERLQRALTPSFLREYRLPPWSNNLAFLVKP